MGGTPRQCRVRRVDHLMSVIGALVARSELFDVAKLGSVYYLILGIPNHTDYFNP